MKIFYFLVSHLELPDPLPEALRVICVANRNEVCARAMARKVLLDDPRYGFVPGPRADLGGYKLTLIATDSASQGEDEPVAEDNEGGRRFDFQLGVQPCSLLSESQTISGHNVTGAQAIDAISELFAGLAPKKPQSVQDGVTAESKAEAFDAMAEAVGEDEDESPAPDDEAVSEDMIPALRGSGVVVREPTGLLALFGMRFPKHVQLDCPDLEGVGDTTGLRLAEDDERFDAASRETLLRILTGDRELLRLIWLHLAANRDRLPEIPGVPAQRMQGGSVRLPQQRLCLLVNNSAPLKGLQAAWAGPDEGDNSTERMRGIANEFREALRLTIRYLLVEAGWELAE